MQWLEVQSTNFICIWVRTISYSSSDHHFSTKVCALTLNYPSFASAPYSSWIHPASEAVNFVLDPFLICMCMFYFWTTSESECRLPISVLLIGLLSQWWWSWTLREIGRIVMASFHGGYGWRRPWRAAAALREQCKWKVCIIMIGGRYSFPKNHAPITFRTNPTILWY